MLIILFSQADHRFGYTSGSEKEYHPIVSDGNGYYAYLPQYIVYPDSAKFSFYDHLNKRYSDKKYFAMLKTDDASKTAENKFYIGTALLQAPFFYLAHKIHLWNGWQADGYTLGYRFSIQLAALFYWLIGVIALFRLFTRLGFNRLSILIGIVVITFGTNLNFYTSYWVSVSHVYSFSMVACFLNLAHRWALKNQSKDLVIAFFLLGLIAIIRPINVLVIFMVPFFFVSFREFLERVKHIFKVKYFALLFGILLASLPVFLHLLVQYDQKGTLTFYSYGDEGFSNALTPQFINVLFSFHKGFFVYAPAMLAVFIGIFYFIKKSNRYFLYGWTFTFFSWLYVISAWWCWDYGGGLGMRPLIEMLPLLLFPMLYLFKYGSRIILLFSGIVFIGGIYLYQLFQFQFNKDIIHYNEMNYKYFKYVFHKTDDRFRWMIDFDLLREYLPEGQKSVSWEIPILEASKWGELKNLDSARIEFRQEDNRQILVYFPTEKEENFLGQFKGEIKLNRRDCNPVFSVKYFENDLLIKESVNTIGSNIENPFSFESFSIDVNHILNNFTRIELAYSDGGCAADFRNVKFEKYWNE